MNKGLQRGLLVVIVALGTVIAALMVRLVTLDSGAGRGESGAVTIGGPFALTDHTGQRTTDASFRGRLMLVYFGFTFCPDICPTELQSMSVALDQLGAEAAKVAPIFVTVDPERDTIKVMADYVGNFHPSMIGLTGSAEEVAAAARAYRVYFAKNRPKEGGDYQVDHSGFIYLMGRDGRYLAHLRAGSTPEEISALLRKHL